jgi:cytoskeleton protein RodZ
VESCAVESFGARLKREREKRKISLEDISLSTKIGTRFLLAIEEEHFDQLPGGIFNKGFVRAYAHHLGVNEEEAIAEYLATLDAKNPQPQGGTAAEAPDPQLVAWAANLKVQTESAVRIPWGTLALGLLIVAFVLALWGFHNRQSQPQSRLLASPAGQPLEPSTPHEAKPPVSESQASVPVAANTNPNPPPSSDAGAVEATSLRTQASAENAAPPGTALPAGNFSVSVKARESSWLSITADGKQIMQDTIAAPAERSVEAQKQVVVHAGNLGALEISFNGQKVPIAGVHGEVKTLVFDAHGLQPALPNNSSVQAVPAR